MNLFKRPAVHYGKTPQPETPYQKAAQVWDERLGSARVQARNWRYMAFGSLILSGGPASVYADDAPGLDPEILELGVPVFGICYGFQAMARQLGGDVANTGGREFGRTTLSVNGEGILHQGLTETQPVWMSHNDAVQVAPEGFTVTASTPGAPVAAFECVERRMAGVQYHPEASPGPQDSAYLFERFAQAMRERRGD